MREIKYRVWSHDENKFLEGGETAQLVVRPLSGRVTDGATTPNVTLLQYVGLKDMNKVNIYEGYILKIPDLYEAPENTAMTYHYDIVTFENGSFCVHGEPMFEHWDYFSEECEVVGNIFENAELLNQ